MPPLPAGGGAAGIGPEGYRGTSGAPRTPSPADEALSDTLALPVSAASGTATSDGPEPPPRRRPRKDDERRRVRWIWIAGGPVLLVLAGWLLVGAVSGRSTGTTTSDHLGSTRAPTAGAGPTGRSDAAAATGSVGSAGAAPTAPAPPPSDDTGEPTRPASEPALVASPIVGVQSGKCVDVAGGSTADLTRIDLFTCDDSAAQAISHTPAGELRVLGKCLDAMNQGTADATPIILYTCNGRPNQKWTLAPDGTIRGVQSNLCLDATDQGTADGTPLQLWDCHGGANQTWSS